MLKILIFFLLKCVLKCKSEISVFGWVVLLLIKKKTMITSERLTITRVRAASFVPMPPTASRRTVAKYAGMSMTQPTEHKQTTLY